MLNLSVKEQYFQQIKLGLKTIEGRLAKEKYVLLKNQTPISFNHAYETSIEKIEVYPSFKIMLETVGLEHVLPGVKSIDDGVEIYREFYSSEEEQSNGVVAIFLKK